MGLFQLHFIRAKSRHRRDDMSESKTIDFDRALKDIDDEIDDEIDDIDIEAALIEIGDKLGYDFISSNGSGSFSISDDVEVYVRYTDRGINKLETRILRSNPRFDCTKNTTSVNNLSIELQTAVLIIKDIKSKLM